MMAVQESQISRLEKLLEGRIIKSKRKTYHCNFIDGNCIIFSESGDTKQVMIPVVVALEWISALENGRIQSSMTAREMRNIIAPGSEWAKYQHGFETHLQAIVLSWNQSHFEQ